MISPKRTTFVNATVPTCTSNITPIAHFTNGKIKETSGLTFGQFVMNGEDRKRKQTVLVAETDNMSYIGKNFGPEASKAQSHCRYYVGVVDRKNGKITVYDSEIVEMIPKLPDFQEEEEKDKMLLPGSSDKSYKQKIDDLTASFGSKKKKQAMGSRLRNEVRGEALERALSSAVDNAVIQRGSLTVGHVSEDAVSALIPPCNKDAENPRDVYLLNDLISQEELEMLSTAAKEYFDCKKDILKTWTKSEKFPKYILNHLAILPTTPDNRWMKSKILMYVNYLMKMYLTPSKNFKNKAPLPEEWPDVVKKKLLDNFTQQVVLGSKTTRCVPARLKDKMVLHILVLCLILDEFDLPLNDLQVDLKLGGKSIEKHIRALGCSLKVRKTTDEDGQKLEFKFAMLKIPLTFPDLSKRKKERR